MEELQLQDLQNIEAICSGMTRGQNMTTSRIKKHEPAVEVKQNARPARHEDPTVPSTPANGRESKRPIDDQLPRVPFWFEVVLPVPLAAYIHSPTSAVAL